MNENFLKFEYIPLCMPIPGYICGSCGKFYGDIGQVQGLAHGQAQEHEKIPILDPFSRGLVLKENGTSSADSMYLLITSKKEVIQELDPKSEAQVHDRVYGTYDISQNRIEERIDVLSDTYSASQIRAGIDGQHLSELSPQEMNEFLEFVKEDKLLQLEFGGNLEEVLIRTVPS